MDRMGMHDRADVGSGAVDVAVEPPFRGGHECTDPMAVLVHFDQLIGRQFGIWKSRRGDEKPRAGAHAHISGRALIDAGRVHGQCRAEQLVAQRTEVGRVSAGHRRSIAAVRTVDWVDGAIVIIDQTALPHRFAHLRLESTEAVIDAIQRLAVRGAPAIGATGALAVAMLARNAQRDDKPVESIRADAERVALARPTAVNLRWAIERVLASIDHGYDAVVAAAVRLMNDDVVTNMLMTNRGADLVEALCARAGARDPASTAITVHTHCNTGDLATVEGGTALGVAFRLHERGRLREVIADETRPLLQGSRLTAFELAQRAIPYRLSADGAGPTCVARGLVDVVLIGADRVAANGDTANKIGSYPLALACHRAGVPFVVVAPESTIDPSTENGAAIDIEMRSEDEVTHLNGVEIAPKGSRAVNFAFDVTPADLITAIVTEHRVIRPTETARIAAAL